LRNTATAVDQSPPVGFEAYETFRPPSGPSHQIMCNVPASSNPSFGEMELPALFETFRAADQVGAAVALIVTVIEGVGVNVAVSVLVIEGDAVDVLGRVGVTVGVWVGWVPSSGRPSRTLTPPTVPTHTRFAPSKAIQVTPLLV